MKNAVLYAVLVLLPSGLFAVGEKTLSIGGVGGWNAVVVKNGIVEFGAVRPAAVLSLSSAGTLDEDAPDLYLSFDELIPRAYRDSARNYTVSVGAAILAAPKRFAHNGAGAALFSGGSSLARQSSGDEPLVFIPNSPAALFAPGHNIGDFSIELWLYPAKMESGEEIFDWTSTLRMNSRSQTANRLQTIRAITGKNRINWNFTNFFCSPDGHDTQNIELSSHTPLTPGRWSHHLIRFDSTTGLIEYLIDGSIEAAAHATVSGHEGAEVWTPVAGERGRFSVGRQFNGLIDELRLKNRFEDGAKMRRYSSSGGYIETEAADLGGRGNTVNRVFVSGGTMRPGTGNNAYKRDGTFRFPGGEELQCFIRAGEDRFKLESAQWLPFTPSEAIYGVSGRFVQMRVDFYPSGDRESSPYLEEIKLEYLPKGSPRPPLRLIAAAHDGSVDISWNEILGEDAAGYVVFYGIEKGEYFGTESGRGSSPVDAGKNTSIHLDSLKNGVLYYFAVAAYDDAGPASHGELSREVSARPLRMLE